MTALRRVLGPVAAGLLLFGLLALPAVPWAYPDGLLTVPLEWIVVVSGLLLITPSRKITALICALGTVVLVALLTLKGADIAMLSALNRPFNPVVDMFLVSAGLNVLAGSIGQTAPYLVVAAGVVLLVGIAVLLYLALRSLARQSVSGAGKAATGVLLVGTLGLAAANFGQGRGFWRLPFSPPGATANVRLATDQVTRGMAAASDLRRFRVAAADDPYRDETGLFDMLKGRDVIVLFVESYGRASFDNALYADTHVPTLQTAQAKLADAGFAMKSGWLNSPTAGGQSWLAHGTLSSGLRTTDQGRYGAMLASGRQSLFHLAQASGFRTAAVMPAITLAWPEGLTMGFDTILAADDLGYAGQPFNWVTMPDQYTLNAFERLLPKDPRPDFLQIALISSHAPWVPIPEMVDWDAVGDGTVFDQWATTGDPPAVVWKDADRVRDQYRRAIDYALNAATEYAARRADQPLIVLLGDHQAAGFVAGSDNRDVPVHLLGPPDLVEKATAWSWRDGMIPDPMTPAWPMEDFRDRFIETYSAGYRMKDSM